MTTPSAARAVTSSIEVAAGPADAFAVLTEEIGCWCPLLRGRTFVQANPNMP